MTITEVRPHLYLVGLEQKIERFGVFIGSWVKDLTEEEKGREGYFIKTCIQGISEYIMSRS